MTSPRIMTGRPRHRSFRTPRTREMTMRQTLNALLAALAITGVHAKSSDAGAQSYPSRPITMVVPFAAGGGTDTLARIVAEGMKASLKQPVIVENLPGAAGSVALCQGQPRRTRRLHRRVRQLGHPCRRPCNAGGAIRCRKGLCRCFAGRYTAAGDHREQARSGERLAGIDRLAQGQPGPRPRSGQPVLAARRMWPAYSSRPRPERACSSYRIVVAVPNPCRI